MPNPSATPTPITPPRVPFLDERTGLIDRAWYQFFLSLYRTADSVVSVQDLNFSVDPLLSSYDAALRALAQTTETQPSCCVESLQQQLNELRQEVHTQSPFDGAAVTLIGGNTNSIVYQSSPNSTTFLPAPSSFLLVDSVDVLSTEASDPIVIQPALYLQYGTDDTLSWNSTYDLSVAYASALIGGSTGSIAYQSNENVTTFLNIGAAAQILKVNAGATAPQWVSGAALTKTDDTNVTLTLGGTPATSLLAATSLTLGWNGQLAVSRGGTGVSTATANYVFAGPTSGVAAAPSFRALVSGDIPALSYVSSVSGTSGRITSTGGLTPVIDLASGVATPGTTGSSTLIPVITIDTYGRVTSITTAANPQGTVTSVTGTSPVVSSGGATPAISLASGYGDTQNPYASKTANYVLAAPNGSAGVPTFRALVAADIPSLSYVSSVSATAPITSTGGLTPTIGVTSAALTKTDDTNVTLTLGGSPTTSLLAATSLTLGWTGQLAVSRGGTGVSTTTANYVFAGPTSGGAAAPAFRALVSSDIPSLTYVSSVSGTLPISSSGGLTPTISISQATSSTNGYLSSTDWTTFNNKQSTSSPVTKTANFSVASTDVWLINNKTGSSCTVTLPSASTSSGRVLYFLNYQDQTLVSASSNVVPLAGGAATTAILEAVAGSNATLVSDGTNWVMTQYDSNNSLQLG